MSDYKNKGNTTLFDKEDINLYDTITLNTENLMDTAKEIDNMGSMNLTLEDFEQYKSLNNNKYNFDDLNEMSKSKEYADTEKLSLIEEERKKQEQLQFDERDLEIIDIKQDTSPYENIKQQGTFDLEDEMALSAREIPSRLTEVSEEISDSYGKVKITAIGVGGCGCNAIGRMRSEGINNIELIAIDTSLKTLENTKADKKLLIGEKLLGGHGSGNDVDKAKESFEHSKTQIQSLLEGTDMVFITGGLGRGTGSAGLVEVGKYAREVGILTIGFATLPKVMEADLKLVEQYYELFTEAVDSNVIIENDRVTKVAYDLPISQAVKIADQMLVDGIKGISDLIINPGKINLDYADIKTAFTNQGSCIMGIGYGSGEDLVIKAIDNSINSELVDLESMKTANTIIFNISCSKNTITIKEATDGTDLIYSKNSSKDIQHMLFGYSYDETLVDKVKVTFIATGTKPIDFSNYKNQNKRGSFQSSFTKRGGLSGDLFTTVGGPSSGPDFFN